MCSCVVFCKIELFELFVYFQIIDTMALHMPPEKLFQQLVSYLDAHLNNNQSVMVNDLTFFLVFCLGI